MKPFDLEKAKAGAPVVTRDGRKARIVCFDIKNEDYPIGVVLEDRKGGEYLGCFTNQGRYNANDLEQNVSDLFMAPVKTKYYIGIYRDEHGRLIPTPVSDEISHTERYATTEEFVTVVTFEVEEEE